MRLLKETSQYSAAVYAPLEQGARPRSIPLSFFTTHPQRLEEKCTAEETFITGLLGGSVGRTQLATLGSAR